MVKVAQIIIDVPLMQTDQPYTYLPAEGMENLLDLGMRVHVPFGKGNRLVQGIIIGFSELAIEEVKNLKYISELLDASPVLNEEQLALADKMRETVFSYKISCLKAMLPNLLNSTYDKAFRPLDEETREKYFKDTSQLKFSKLSQEMQLEMISLKKQGKVQVEYLAEQKNTSKFERFLSVADMEILKNTDIPKRAKKKQELKDYLLEHPKQLSYKELTKYFSPAIIKYFIDEKLLLVEEVSIRRSQAYFDSIKPDQPLKLNDEQELVYQTIINGDNDKPYLLEGVTGSGKTEVYLQLIADSLAQGKTAIMLVPEISLTPQITNRFIARFGDQVAILHSGLSDGEKYDEWQKIEEGSASVVVGARSAIFAPLKNIGTIIIDEEHESSYKQDSSPRYHARDIASFRADWHKARLVLGSATPSLESRARAEKGVYQFLQLTKRANPRALIPQVELVDLRETISQKPSSFSPKLLDKIKEKLERKEQVVLMLNRRGYSSFLLCRDCGFVIDCPNCDISLTLHMDTKTLNCHYCDYKQAIPKTCPSCSSRKIRYYGTGTQKVEEELQTLLPDSRIIRMDVDTTKKKGAHEKLLRDFGEHKADILLGTQMIAKGLDFPNVTLVGVINADTSLNLPDFRSSERTFQLLTQVAGRAGRADKEGEVIIQTFNPEHYAIKLAKEHDYEGFYKQEMNFRRSLGYPPYFYTVQIVVSHKIEDVAIKKSYEFISLLQNKLSDKAKIMGPTPKPIARTHNMYHYQILIKYRFEDQLMPTLNDILNKTQESDNRDLRVIIDSEPQNFI